MSWTRALGWYRCTAAAAACEGTRYRSTWSCTHSRGGVTSPHRTPGPIPRERSGPSPSPARPGTTHRLWRASRDRPRATRTAGAPASWRLCGAGFAVGREVAGPAEPVQVAPDAGGERGLRRPVEQFLGRPVGDADAL